MPSPERPAAEIEAWLTWLRAPAFGDQALREAVAHHGGARAALDGVLDDPAGHGLPPQTAAALRRPDPVLLARDREWLGQPGHALLTFDDPDYPPLLARAVHAPAALFVSGRRELLGLPLLAIVGSRSATPSGLRHAGEFARALCACGLGIASGLALGVDAAAHVAALEAGGTTVAVCGTGLDQVYPERHRELAARIEQSGALVSEFPPGTAARAHHFPRRNRIIAGLALGTLVVEASLRSGSLITARLAAECGREVFALPGSLQNPMARGCHRLIREGATLVECAGDVLEPLRALVAGLRECLEAETPPTEPRADGGAGTAGRDPEYRSLLTALGHDPVSVDELAQRTALPAAAVSSMLLMLELDGVVEALPGARYARARERAR